MKKMKIIQCQEEVSKNKRSYKHKKIRPDPFPRTEGEYHQCTLTARYRIDSIDLYVCSLHASGVDKKQLIKL